MRDLVARRMHRHRLWGQPAASIEAVVRDYGAMQAQEFAPAMWSIAQRLAGTTEVDVRAAFDAGVLLRTHILRPTWHFVHADDIRWMLSATAARVHAVNRYYYRRAGVDADVAARSRTVFERILGDGEHLTRRELATALAAAGMPVTGDALAHVVMHAELDGVLVSGAMREKQHTYALFDLRAPGEPVTDRDAAVANLTRRYFAAHGPATVKDFRTWASFPAAEARRGLEMLGAEAVAEEIDGRVYWSVGADSGGSAPTGPVVDLLQDYDEYVVGYFDSRDVMLRSDGPATALAPRVRALLLDGRLLGHWRHTTGGTGVVVETIVARPLTRAESVAMDAAVARFGAFLGVPATWR